MGIRSLAIQAWEDASQDALVTSARQALTATLGADAAGLLSFHALSRLDGADLVVFVDSEGVFVAAHRPGDVWRVVTVEDDDGWVLRGGPFGDLVELGEWFADNPPDAVAEWEPGGTYEVDDRVTYDGVEYVCIQSHTNHDPNHTPDVTPSLWEPV